MKSGSKIVQHPGRSCRGWDAARNDEGVERAAFERRRLNLISQGSGDGAAGPTYMAAVTSSGSL